MGKFALRTLIALVVYAICALGVGWLALSFPFLGGIDTVVMAEISLAAVLAVPFSAWWMIRKARRKARAEATVRTPPLLLRVAIALVLAALVFAGAWRLVREFIPAGVGPRSWGAYVQWSYDRNDLVSPDGLHRVMLRTNDPGAMRSGNCWTWVIVRSALRGKRVAAEGYTPEIDDNPFRWYRWNADGSLTLDFLARHRSTNAELAPVTLTPADLD